MIADRITRLGSHISYELVSEELNRKLDKIDPILSGANLSELRKIFKLDFYIDNIIERLYNVDLIHIESKWGKGDELYYFRNYKGRLFHGDRIWSAYHPFIKEIESLEPTDFVNETSWFVGSRNNYTHQLIDFYPNLLVRNKPIFDHLPMNIPYIIGNKNQILNDICSATKDSDCSRENETRFISCK